MIISEVFGREGRSRCDALH